MCYHFFHVAVNRTWLPSRRGVAALAALISYLLGGFLCSVRADSASAEAATHLGDRVAARLNSKVEYHLEFRDLTGQMPAEELSAARSAFLAALTNRGVHVNEFDTSGLIRVSLSSDTRSRLWIAQFTVVMDPATEIEAFALLQESSLSPTTTFALRKQLLFQQRTPVLDFALLGQTVDANTPLLVLTREQIGVFLFRNGRWEPQGSYLPVQFRRFPRDVIGRVKVTGSNFEANVANVKCSGSSADLSKTSCISSVEWEFGVLGGFPLSGQYVIGRNWFELMEDVDRLTKPFTFFSVAEFERDGKPALIAAGADRKLYIGMHGTHEPFDGPTDWGSQLASLRSACGEGPYLLTTVAGDYNAEDRVQAYRFSGNGFVTAGSATAFEGPVEAMWPEPNFGARVIVHNLKTGFYEAYLLNAACNR